MASADTQDPSNMVDHQEPSIVGIEEPSSVVKQEPPSSVTQELQETPSPVTQKPSSALTQKLSSPVIQDASSSTVENPSLAIPQDTSSPAVQKTLTREISPRKIKWVARTVQSFLTGDVEARHKVIAYLKRFNHLPERGDENAENLSNALAAFQSSANLVKTEIYDEATEALMKKPRCGFGRSNVDSLVVLKTRPSVASFVESKSKWDHPNITYRFENFTPTMTPARLRQAIQLSLGGWAAITPLTFTEVTSGEVILIRFVSGAHGDKDFDGPGTVYAHACPPGPGLGGDTHFDEDEYWNPQFLAGVALHEFGHALGLDHSKVPEAVMWEFFNSLLELHDDDIHGIHSIYGWREPRWQKIDFNSATISILASENEVYQLHKMVTFGDIQTPYLPAGSLSMTTPRRFNSLPPAAPSTSGTRAVRCTATRKHQWDGPCLTQTVCASRSQLAPGISTSVSALDTSTDSEASLPSHVGN
jgi:hypothetical protein